MAISEDCDLTPEERRTELAGILAAGVLRLHLRSTLSVGPPSDRASRNPSDSPASCLEVPVETVLSVHNG